MLLCLVLAAITDLLDGALARYKKEQTPFGSIFDPLADRLLFFISVFLLAYSQINAKIFYIALVSEIILLLLALFYMLFLKYLKLKYTKGATIFGKAKGITQITIIFFLFMNFLYPQEIFIQLSTWLMVASTIFLYLSFLKHLFYYAFTASNRILR